MPVTIDPFASNGECTILMSKLQLNDQIDGMQRQELQPPKVKKPYSWKEGIESGLPSERQQDFLIQDKQIYLRPYAEDLIKSLLTEASDSNVSVKVALSANLPRPLLVELVRKMASCKKMSFLESPGTPRYSF